MDFHIGNCMIGDNHPTFIIAEMSANHGHSIDRAIEIIRSADRAGADAVKLQTYTADTITLKSSKKDFLLSKDSPWVEHNTLWDLYNEAYTPWEWHGALFEEARHLGLEIFSSPFDHTAVDFLEQFDPPAYKIASPEITDIPLIEKVAATGKPIIISTGLANFADIELVVERLKNKGLRNIALLKCTTAYPAPVNEMNLLTIKDMKQRFGVASGLSDHSVGSAVPTAAVALGANLIEKHFRLHGGEDSVDSFFSMDENDFRKMVSDVRTVEQAIGKVNYDISSSSSKNLNGRRSLYVVKPIKLGEAFTEDNIRSIRPAGGLHPKYYDEILKGIASKALEVGDRLSWDVVKQERSS